MANNTVSFLGRFFSVFIVHLQMAPKINNGLNIMKYTINHPEEFCSFAIAFSLGLQQEILALCVELLSIFYVCSLNSVVDAVTKIILLSFIIKTGEHFAHSLPKNIKIRANLKYADNLMETTNYRAIKNDILLPRGLSRCGWKFARYLYKIRRIFYTTFVYYVLPFLVVAIQVSGNLERCGGGGGH